MSQAAAANVLELTEKRAFRMRLHDRTLDDMELVGEWEGLAKLKHSASGLHLIVLMAENRIVGGSPSLIADLGITQLSTPVGLKAGEIYVGVVLDEKDKPLHHLVLLPGEFKGPWGDSMKWAESIGGALPSRREQRLLYEKAKEHFTPVWHWSNEQHAAGSGYAWGQDFGYGHQLDDHKSYEGRARAVRRLPI